LTVSGFYNPKLNDVYDAKNRVTNRDHYESSSGIHIYFGESPDQWVIDNDLNPEHVYAWKRASNEVPPSGTWYELYQHRYANNTITRGFRGVNAKIDCSGGVTETSSHIFVYVVLTILCVILGGLLIFYLHGEYVKRKAERERQSDAQEGQHLPEVEPLNSQEP